MRLTLPLVSTAVAVLLRALHIGTPPAQVHRLVVEHDHVTVDWTRGGERHSTRYPVRQW